jgi:hypothetical protein
VAELGRAFPASEVGLSVRTESGEFSIDGKDWATEAEESLLRRICGNELLFEDIRPYTKAIRRLVGDDGQVLGRASLLPSRVINNSHHDGVGVVTTKGATACFGAFCGVMVGVPTRASRDGADFVAEPHILRSWAADQAKIFSLLLEGERQAEVAEYVAALGADTADLKVCEIGGNYLSLPELGELLKQKREIWIAQNAGVGSVYWNDGGDQQYSRTDELISVEMGLPMLLFSPTFRPTAAWFDRGSTLEDLILSVVETVFEIDHDVMTQYHTAEDGEEVYYTAGPAWRSASGGILRVRAKYYCRQMSREQIDEYLVKDAR